MQRPSRALRGGEGSFLLSSRTGVFAPTSSPWRRPVVIIVVCAVMLLIADLTGLNHLRSSTRPKYSLHTSTNTHLLNLVRFRNVDALRSTFRYERAHMRWRPRPVVYRGAPWRTLVGMWMLECDAKAEALDVREAFYGKECPGNCNGNGACDYELGQCRCNIGYNGSDCAGVEHNPCNLPSSEGLPYGGYVMSTCAASCNFRNSHCFCGERSPYPERPVVAPCGFALFENGGMDVTRVDEDQLWSKDPERPGWCMADPFQVAQGQQKLQRECYNNYDGGFGVFSEQKVLSFCVNQCNGPRFGHCVEGACLCKEGWYGVDCSIPSALAIPKLPWNPPPWLKAASSGATATQRKQLRPLIYVYDLPRRFTSQLLEGRQWKFNCAIRLYDSVNYTDFNPRWMYGAEMLLYESFLSSPHRTNNPLEADYFFVPLLGSCVIAEADANPRMALSNHALDHTSRVRPNMMMDWALDVQHYLRTTYPYWDKHQGKDHIWMFLFDEGACYAPEAIWNSVMLTHWGNTGSVHRGCQTAYAGDKCETLHKEKRGGHPCYNPMKDIVVPTRKAPSFISKMLRTKEYAERPNLFFFRGNLGASFEWGRPEAEYSMGIRQKVAKYFSSEKDKNGELGSLSESGVVVEVRGKRDYNEELASSRFCGVFPGDGFSARMEDSMLQGCIPVIIQDGIELPYENVLDYESFSVRISERNIPNLVKILKSIPEERVRAMLKSVQSLLSRWFYRSALEITASQQQEETGKRPDWASTLEDLNGDDAFQSIIQILHYKMYHDSWRRSKDETHWRPSGMPSQCAA